MNYNYYKNLINNKQKHNKTYYTDTNGEKMNLEIVIIKTDKKER